MKSSLFLTIVTAFLISEVAVAEPPYGNERSNGEKIEALPLSRNHSLAKFNLAPKENWPEPIEDEVAHAFFLAEIFEYRWNENDDEARWDAFGWYGGDYNRVWIKSEGSASTAESSGEGDVQLLYGRLISRYFDFQVGLRYEQLWDGNGEDNSRSFAAIGVQGLAPYYFDIEPTLFVSQDGDVSARFTGTYDILLTQRLILQPRIEGNAAVQENREFGVGSGINDIEAGIRIRYEVQREFAPYLGIVYGRTFGETKDFARLEGEDTQECSLVAGVRFWF